MQLSIGNAPCSWGVEFADDPRNPPWAHVLDEAKAAGYTGIELGPLGYMPEDPSILGPALAERELTLIGGVLFRPFHDPAQWAQVQDAATRTCRALRSNSAVLRACAGWGSILFSIWRGTVAAGGRLARRANTLSSSCISA